MVALKALNDFECCLLSPVLVRLAPAQLTISPAGATHAYTPLGRKADDGSRTRDLELGKLALYQLSYVRVGAF